MQTADRSTPSSGTPATGPRSSHPADYRLRGLDLGARAAPETSLRPVRKRRRNGRPRHRLVVQWVIVVIVALLASLLARAFLLEPFSMPSNSMVPTLQPGDELLVVRSALLSSRVTTGQIVVFRRPSDVGCTAAGKAPMDMVKRVIAMPGQMIWSTGPTIYVDGRVLNEPGWYNSPFGQLGDTPIRPTKVPAGDYYVLGDNREGACDSRSFGPIPASLLVGRVAAVVSRHGHPHVHVF
jgi:signal peptidase I